MLKDQKLLLARSDDSVRFCVGARETAEAQQHAAGKRRQAHAKELGLR